MDKHIELANGIIVPIIGFGTFKMAEGEETYRAVINALEAGYRHIDTAEFYGNEISVGRAIKHCGIARSEIFLTTKVWNSNHGYKETREAFYKSLKRLDSDYIDLYLIHWPKDCNEETWKAICGLYEEKAVRAIGVSNFKQHHLEELAKATDTLPMLNQIELHPRLTQKALCDYCCNNRIAVEAWSPLMRGRILEDAGLCVLAKKHGTTSAQIILRWHIQSGRIIIPKSVTQQRIRQNIALFDFSLDDDEMELIDSMNRNERIGPDPDLIDF